MILTSDSNNISAQEVENILQGHPDVMDVAAVAMPDERLGEVICVYVVPKSSTSSLKVRPRAVRSLV